MLSVATLPCFADIPNWNISYRACRFVQAAPWTPTSRSLCLCPLSLVLMILLAILFLRIPRSHTCRSPSISLCCGVAHDRFRRAGHKAIEQVAAYYEKLQLGSKGFAVAPSMKPGDIYKQIPGACIRISTSTRSKIA